MSTTTRVLIAYGTTEGHTARIAQYLADVIRSWGHEAHPVDLERARAPDPNDYDAVIVGASVHMGKHQTSVRNFVKQNRPALDRLPTAFFSVSLAAHGSTKAVKEVTSYIAKFAQQTGWRATKVGVFAGALLYTRYGFFTRWIMRKIARDKGSLDLDTSRDYVYTDWDAVRRFGEEFLDILVPEHEPLLARAG
jgi:menaquinone-dependent protoporphyrinogen oxidase